LVIASPSASVNRKKVYALDALAAVTALTVAPPLIPIQPPLVPIPGTSYFNGSGKT
jgi:hypothetical protein